MKPEGRAADLTGRCAVAKRALEDQGFTVTFDGYVEFGFNLHVDEATPDFQKIANLLLAAWSGDLTDAREDLINAKRTLVVRFRETK